MMVNGPYPSEERYGLIYQTNRAEVSIPTDIAEDGRNYKKDTFSFFIFQEEVHMK